MTSPPSAITPRISQRGAPFGSGQLGDHGGGLLGGRARSAGRSRGGAPSSASSRTRSAAPGKVLVLAAPQAPEEGAEPDQPHAEGDRDQEDEHGHAAASASRRRAVGAARRDGAPVQAQRVGDDQDRGRRHRQRRDERRDQPGDGQRDRDAVVEQRPARSSAGPGRAARHGDPRGRSTTASRRSRVKTKSAASRPASEAEAGAIETCAAASAAVSFSPSPTIRTRWPAARSAFRRAILSAGVWPWRALGDAERARRRRRPAPAPSPDRISTVDAPPPQRRHGLRARRPQRLGERERRRPARPRTRRPDPRRPPPRRSRSRPPSRPGRAARAARRSIPRRRAPAPRARPSTRGAAGHRDAPPTALRRGMRRCSASARAAARSSGAQRARRRSRAARRSSAFRSCRTTTLSMLGQPLQRRAVLHHDALARAAAPRPTTCTTGTASPSAQGQVMMSTEIATKSAARQSPSVASSQPTNVAGRQEVHHRRIEPRRPVGDADIAAAALLGGLEHLHASRPGTSCPPARSARTSTRAGQVERAGLELVARADAHRRRLARDQRAVDVGLAPQDARHPPACARRRRRAAIMPGSTASSGTYSEPPSGRMRIAPLAASRARPGHRAARAVAHQAVEIAADQQEEQQRHGGVEERPAARRARSRRG